MSLGDTSLTTWYTLQLGWWPPRPIMRLLLALTMICNKSSDAGQGRDLRDRPNPGLFPNPHQLLERRVYDAASSLPSRQALVDH